MLRFRVNSKGLANSELSGVLPRSDQGPFIVQRTIARSGVEIKRERTACRLALWSTILAILRSQRGCNEGECLA